METNLDHNNNILFVQVEMVEILLVVLFPEEAELIWSLNIGSGQDNCLRKHGSLCLNLLLSLVGGVSPL